MFRIIPSPQRECFGLIFWFFVFSIFLFSIFYFLDRAARYRPRRLRPDPFETGPVVEVHYFEIFTFRVHYRVTAPDLQPQRLRGGLRRLLQAVEQRSGRGRLGGATLK